MGDLSMYVVLEWNQASGQPRLSSDDLYDTATEAHDMADAARTELARTGPREQYTVHEIDMEEIEK